MYYVDGRREEVVTYSTPLDTFGNKLGTIARKRGLSESEEDAYRSSLGSLCAQIMKSSQQSLTKNQEVISDTNEPQRSTQRASSRSRKDSTPDIEKVRYYKILNVFGIPYVFIYLLSFQLLQGND